MHLRVIANALVILLDLHFFGPHPLGPKWVGLKHKKINIMPINSETVNILYRLMHLKVIANAAVILLNLEYFGPHPQGPKWVGPKH